MSNNDSRAASIVAEIKTTFGSPAMLGDEDPRRYHHILTEVVKAFWPRDIITKMFIRDIANAVWLDLRYDRISTTMLDVKIQQQLKFHAQRLMPNPSLKDNNDINATSSGMGEVVPEADNILTTPEGKEAQSRAFQQSLGFLKDVDDMKNANFNRRNTTIEMTLRYQELVAPELDQPKALIDGTVEVVAVETNVTEDDDASTGMATSLIEDGALPLAPGADEAITSPGVPIGSTDPVQS